MPNKPKMVWIRCEWCGRLRQVEARDIKRGWGRFCGRKCAGLWLSAYRPEIYKGKSGAENANWKGGRVKHHKGYVYRYAPDHPRASAGPGKIYVFEHILTAEKKLGRLLKPDERVHHRNEYKDQNHPENLQVFENNADHTRHHWKAGTYGKQ